MNAQRLQGTLFSFFAISIAVATVAMGRFAAQAELIVLASLIVILGVPHGALDTVFANRLYGIRTLWDWLRFGVIYLFLAALVIGLWVVAPVWFLIGFLLISVAHFSGDPAEGTPVVTRILYAGSVIILPSFLHGEETARLFVKLVGSSAAHVVVPSLAWLAWPWFVCLMLAAVECLRRDRLTAFEITSVGILAILAPPLVSFTVFFCGMHGARHIIRTFIYSGRSSFRLLMMAAFLPMLGVVVASTIAWYFLKNTPIDARVLQVVFVGLAALTFPHMILVERVRFSGWLKSDAIP